MIIFFFQTESSASAAIDDVGSKTKLDFLGKLFVYYTYVHFHNFVFAVQLSFDTCNFFFKYYRKRIDNLPHKYIKFSAQFANN